MSETETPDLEGLARLDLSAIEVVTKAIEPPYWGSYLQPPPYALAEIAIDALRAAGWVLVEPGPEQAANVVIAPIITRLPTPPRRVLHAAMQQDLASVAVCGLTADGEEWFASSDADAGDVIYKLRRMEHALMRIVDELSD